MIYTFGALYGRFLITFAVIDAADFYTEIICMSSAFDKASLNIGRVS